MVSTQVYCVEMENCVKKDSKARSKVSELNSEISQQCLPWLWRLELKK